MVYDEFCLSSICSPLCAVQAHTRSHDARSRDCSYCDAAQVARYCQEGFRAAVDTNCYDACLNGGRLQSYLTDRRLDEVCHRALKVAPRPLCHDACVRGYRSGAEDMSIALLKRMAHVSTAPQRPRRASSFLVCRVVVPSAQRNNNTVQ